MQTPFVDRRRELAALDGFLAEPGAGIFVLYGRRRVGKSALLDHWLRTRLPLDAAGGTPDGLYWVATNEAADYQLVSFSAALAAHSQGTLPASFLVQTWEQALEMLVTLARQRKGPFVVVIDEFTNLVKASPALPSVLNRVWERKLQQLPNLRLILTGSLVGMMEDQVLSGSAPLYGRARSLLRLRPLDFGALAEFLPSWPNDARLAAYAVGGGIPAYLGLFRNRKSFSAGLLESALAPQSPFFTDAPLLLNERFANTTSYETLLSVIAKGAHDWGAIASAARMSPTEIGSYLQQLMNFELIEKRMPVLSGIGTKRGRYHLRDPFLRFYYRFIVPNLAAVQRGATQRLVATIEEDLRAYIGTNAFEPLCRDWVMVQAELGRLDWLPEEIGSWWRDSTKTAQGVQLDVVAASNRTKRLFIGEAKWGAEPVSRDVVVDLPQRAQRMPEVASGKWAVSFACFARAGFTPAAQVTAKELGIQLLTLDDVADAHVELVTGIASSKPARRRTR